MSYYLVHILFIYCPTHSKLYTKFCTKQTLYLTQPTPLLYHKAMPTYSLLISDTAFKRLCELAGIAPNAQTGKGLGQYIDSLAQTNTTLRSMRSPAVQRHDAHLLRTKGNNLRNWYGPMGSKVGPEYQRRKRNITIQPSTLDYFVDQAYNLGIVAQQHSPTSYTAICLELLGQGILKHG